MKTLAFLFIMGISGFFSTQNQSIIGSPKENAPSRQEIDKTTSIVLDIEFGLKNKSCEGFGICKVRVGTGKKRGEAKGLARVKDGRVYEIEFYKKSMSSEIIEEYFSNDHFLLEKDFSSTFKHKGEEFSFNLKAGKYKLKKTKLGFVMGEGGVPF